MVFKVTDKGLITDFTPVHYLGGGERMEWVVPRLLRGSCKLTYYSLSREFLCNAIIGFDILLKRVM